MLQLQTTQTSRSCSRNAVAIVVRAITLLCFQPRHRFALVPVVCTSVPVKRITHFLDFTVVRVLVVAWTLALSSNSHMKAHLNHQSPSLFRRHFRPYRRPSRSAHQNICSRWPTTRLSEIHFRLLGVLTTKRRSKDNKLNKFHFNTFVVKTSLNKFFFLSQALHYHRGVGSSQRHRLLRAEAMTLEFRWRLWQLHTKASEVRDAKGKSCLIRNYSKRYCNGHCCNSRLLSRTIRVCRRAKQSTD